MTIVLGASRLIGYKLSNRESAQVARNIETKEENSARPMPTTGQLEALRKEKHRVEGGIPATRIELGETVIIPHWDIRRLWNHAMDAYIRLEQNGHGNFVYEETTGWDIIEHFLKHAKEKLAPMEKGICSQIGFKSHRDRGWQICDYCSGGARIELIQCSRCRKVHYCSKSCQRLGWKKHKAQCTPAS
jgi:hypothetical protein